MGSTNSKEESRAVGGVVGGGASLATGGAGIGLMILGGPVGIVAGGILLGTGISSAANTVQQCASDKEFNYAKLGISAGVGALGGTVAAPFSVAGGLAASAITSTAAKVATVVGSEVVGGAVSGGLTNAASKKASGEHVTWKDVGTGALTGALAGGVGGAAGQATTALTQGAKTVGAVASKAANLGKVTVGAVGGAAGGAGSAALATLVENIINKGEFKHSTFVEVMKELGVDRSTADEFWKLLLKNGVIVDEIVQKQIPESLLLPDGVEPSHCQYLNELFVQSQSVTKGMGEAATQGAIIGGVSGAVSTAVQLKQQKKTVKSEVRRRAADVKKGAWSGSIEAEAYARQNNKQVVIHHSDGKTTIHGSKSATGDVHLHYDAKNQHYSPADATGRKITTAPQKGKPGNCFFDSIAHHTGDKPSTLRQRVAADMHEHPLGLKKTHLSELEHGGQYHGGMGKKKPSQETQLRKEIRGKSKLSDEVKQWLIEDSKAAIKEVRSLTRKSQNKMQVANDNQAKFRGRHKVHYLKGDRAGQLAVDIYNPNESGRGPYRLIFKPNGKGDYEYHEFLQDHNY